MVLKSKSDKKATERVTFNLNVTMLITTLISYEPMTLAEIDAQA